MITTGSKWFYGFGLLSLLLAAAYGWSTGGNGLGPLSVGYKGGVGDHFGYGILLSAGVVSLMLGLVATAVRDAEAAPKAMLGQSRQVIDAVFGDDDHAAAVAAVAAVRATLRYVFLAPEAPAAIAAAAPLDFDSDAIDEHSLWGGRLTGPPTSHSMQKGRPRGWRERP